METSPAEIKVGDFIEIGSWDVIGMVVDVADAWSGPDDARRVLVEEDIGAAPRWYHLEAGQFSFAD